MAKIMFDASTTGGPAVEIDLKDARLAAFLAWLVPGLGHMYQGRTGKGVLFFVCIVGTFYYGLYIGGGRVVYASTADVFSRQFLERWQYVCQVGAGLPALPALVQRERVRAQTERLNDIDSRKMAGKLTPEQAEQAKQSVPGPIFGDNFVRPPYGVDKWSVPPRGPGFQSEDRSQSSHTVHHPDELAKWNYELGDYFEIGTVFTIIAGLLNILAVYDAYGGPLVIVPPEEKKKEPDKS